MKSLLENHADGTGTISLVRPEAPPDLSKRWQNSSQAVSKRPHLLSKRPQSPKKVLTELVKTSIEGEPVFPFYNIKSLAGSVQPGNLEFYAGGLGSLLPAAPSTLYRGANLKRKPSCV